MPQSNDTLQGGKIQIRETKRGIELHAFNFERQRTLHIGTLQGVTFEKVVTILRKPEPSISLSQSELGALESLGAMYLRCIPGDKSATYSISIENFKQHAQPYYNPAYGPQWRVPLGCFSATNRTGKRNPIVDNPKGTGKGEYHPVQAQQLPLFRPNNSARFDQYGNFRAGGIS